MTSAASSIASLKKYNLWFSGLHLTAFAVFLVYYITVIKQEFRDASVYRIGVAEVENVEDLSKSLDFPLQPVHIYSSNIPILILVFFLFTSFFHLLYGTDFFGRGTYTKFLQQGWNPVRWLEYGISAGIMIYIISLLSGIRDVTTLAPVVAAVAITQVFGYVNEKQFLNYSKALSLSDQILEDSKNLVMPSYSMSPIESLSSATVTNYVGPSYLTQLSTAAKESISASQSVITTSTNLAWILILTSAWLPILYTITTVYIDAKAQGSEIPNWVLAIIGIQLIMFTWFGVVQLKQTKVALKGVDPLPNFLDIEKQYIKLSFFSKFFLGAFIAYGLVERQNNANEIV
jgi:hypothetical protein